MSEDLPFRLRLLIAITDALREISPANGYAIDVSDAVFRGRSNFGEGDPLPMLSILETPQPPEQIRSPVDAKEAAGPWELIIQGFIEDDRYNPTDPAHMVMADVKKRLVLEKRKVNEGEAFGFSQVTSIVIGPGVVRPADEISAKAYFWLGLAVGIVEDLSDPYA